MLPQLERALADDRPDVIVYDVAAFAGLVPAEKWRIPRIQLSPTYVFSPGIEQVLGMTQNTAGRREVHAGGRAVRQRRSHRAAVPRSPGRLRQVSPDELRDALSKVTKDPDIRGNVDRMQQEIKESGGLTGAADRVESLLEG